MSIMKRDQYGKVLETVLDEAEKSKLHAARWGSRTDRLNAATKEELHELYWVEGLSTSVLAGIYGVMKNDTILKRFRLLGIPTRTRSAANLLRWSQMGDERRERIGKAMSLAHIGKPIPEENLIRRALTRQARPKPSKYETALTEALHQCNLEAIVWFAFGRYTVDIAIPSHKVAIEIGNECHHDDLVVDRDQLKKKLLEQEGWTVLYIATAHIRYNAPDAAQVVAASIQSIATV